MINGDITKETVDGYFTIICHQTNCVTTHAKGLAKAIFDAYPETNIYEAGEKRTPGSYIRTDTYDGKTVLHLNGQNAPGGPSATETREQRLEWMRKILDLVAHNYEKNKLDYAFLFPKLMGCGLAGGNWDEYKALIDGFERKGFKVVIIDFNK